MSSTISITGVQQGIGPNNSTPVRPDINDVSADNDQRNLLLLGLELMQSRPYSDPKSWYQVSGIHGLPFIPWQGEGDASGRKPGGYCTHSSILFLTWHRPYLALFEQALYEDVQAVVASFPEPRRSQLSQVAKSFRIPFWDWATSSRIPSILLQPQVDVEKPEGVVSIPNPLYSYNFKDSELRYFTGTYRNRRTTLRRPAGNDATDSNNDELEAIFQNFWDFSSRDRFPRQGTGAWSNIRERVWHLLNLEQNRYPTFAAFSNNRWVPNNRSSDYDSLEAIHDTIHGVVGGDGHMGDPGYAGFDPIFWLHHCNVDRLYAIWQALHPNQDLNWSFDIPHQTQHRLHWWVPGIGNTRLEKEDTSLVPFRKNPSRYWDSNSVRDFKAFGYTYPELTDWGVISRDELRMVVSAKVNALYGNVAVHNLLSAAAVSQPAPQAATEEVQVPVMVGSVKAEDDSASSQSAKAAVAPPAVALQNAQAVLMGTDVSSNTATAMGSASGHSTSAGNSEPLKPQREYFANIRAPKYDFGGPFAVYVFLGDFTEDPKARQFDPNLIGSWHVFASDISETGCENCKKGAENNLIVTGSVPLTGALVKKLSQGLESLEPAHVTPYLTKNLHWRIHRTINEQTNIPRTNVEDKVKFTVTSAIVSFPDGDHGIPVYSDWNPIPEITVGRPTGAGFDDAEGYEAPGAGQGQHNA